MTHTAIEIAPGITRYIADTPPEPTQKARVNDTQFLLYLNEWRTLQEIADHWNAQQASTRAKISKMVRNRWLDVTKRDGAMHYRRIT